MSKVDAHRRAQLWGLYFLCCVLVTEISWEDATSKALVDLECYKHLRDCWKHDNSDAKCEIIHQLVDAARRGEDLRNLRSRMQVLAQQV